ncbi:hypothetical protein JCM10908_006670 [Rhodotorula pacifica]|uniref:uncharacterized protein n=1 Tax=Rhodotorula pacifica TaxID=1495444 RepID=UPI00316E4385
MASPPRPSTQAGSGSGPPLVSGRTATRSSLLQQQQQQQRASLGGVGGARHGVGDGQGQASPTSSEEAATSSQSRESASAYSPSPPRHHPAAAASTSVHAGPSSTTTTTTSSSGRRAAASTSAASNVDAPVNRRGKWLQSEYDEIWSLGHTYILPALSSSSSASTQTGPSGSPSSAATRAPLGGSLHDWERLRSHPMGLMRTEARGRSASALRNMFVKMRKEQIRVEEEERKRREGDLSVGAGGGGDEGENAATPPAPGKRSQLPLVASSSKLRVRIKTELFEQSQIAAVPPSPSPSPFAASASAITIATNSNAATAPTLDLSAYLRDPTGPSPSAGAIATSFSPSLLGAHPAAQTLSSSAASHANTSANAEIPWTATEDAVLLAALISLPGNAAVPAPTPMREGNGAMVAGGGGEDEREAASTPLARAAEPPRQSQQQHTAGLGAASPSQTPSASTGWHRVHAIAERTYAILEGEGGGREGGKRFGRSVQELESRWRTKWRVDGMTKNLAAPELLLPAIKKEADFLWRITVEVLAQLSATVQASANTGSSAIADSEDNAAATANANASETANASEETVGEGGARGDSTMSAAEVQLQNPQIAHQRTAGGVQARHFDDDASPLSHETPATASTPMIGATKQTRDDDPSAAYPTPSLSTGPLPSTEFDEAFDATEQYRYDDQHDGEPLSMHNDDEQKPAIATFMSTASTELEPAIATAVSTRQISELMQEHISSLTDASSNRPTPLQQAPDKAVGLGLDIGYGFDRLQPRQQQQQHNSAPSPVSAANEVSSLSRPRLTAIPLRRASSAAVLVSPTRSTPAAASTSVTSPSNASFSPFTELHNAPYRANALWRVQQSQPQPQLPAGAVKETRSVAQLAPIQTTGLQVYYQPRPQPMAPFPVGPPQQQQQQHQPPVSPIRSVEGLRASMPYKPFSRMVADPPTLQELPPPQQGAFAFSSSSRGRFSLGTVHEETFSLPQSQEMSPYEPSLQQVRSLYPSNLGVGHPAADYGHGSPGHDPERGIKRRWSEADLYARPPAFLYESSSGLALQAQESALDQAIAAGRPLADHAAAAAIVFDDRFDHDQEEADRARQIDGAGGFKKAEVEEDYAA